MKNVKMKLGSVAFVMVVSAAVANAAIIEPGYREDADTYAAVRYRSFGNTGGQEVYLGVPDLGNAANRHALNMTWSTTADVSFSYTGSKLLTTIATNETMYALEYEIDALTPWNYLLIEVVGRDSGTTLAFNDVMLDGILLGNFEGTGGWFNWNVTDIDLSDGFELTGKIDMTGTFGVSQEKSKIEMKLGSVQAVPEPATMSLLAMGGVALLKRRKA